MTIYSNTRRAETNFKFNRCRSQVCRVAYELMNSLHPDASTWYSSLDDIYYFGGQNYKLNEAVLEHKTRRSHEINLRVGDQIFVHGNHWNGYSKGKNLRTKKVGLYPTFKVHDNIICITPQVFIR